MSQIAKLRTTFVGIVAIPLAVAGSMVLADSAMASFSLVPAQEGEIDVGLGVLDPGQQINYPIPNGTQPYFVTDIDSLPDSQENTPSRLFVDNLTTANTYTNGTTTVNFLAGDAGTEPGGYWYRPSEVREERGQLEVGTYTFTFNDIIPFLEVVYFDTERDGETKVRTLATNAGATLVVGQNPVPGGGNSNLYTQVWKDISFITVELGFDTRRGTGDGVDFRLAAHPVPEPITLLGSGLALGFGVHMKRKLNRKQKA